MFKSLVKLFRSTSSKPRATEPDVEEGLSDAQILREYFSVSKAAKQSLRAFVQLVSLHLGQTESKRLVSAVTRQLQPGTSAVEALAEGIIGESGQRRGKWLMIQVDGRATDEVSWQAEEVSKAFALREFWGGSPSVSVPGVLVSFGAWLRVRQLELLHIDSEGDSYYAVAVPIDAREEALRLSSAAGLKVATNDEFSTAQNDA